MTLPEIRGSSHAETFDDLAERARQAQEKLEELEREKQELERRRLYFEELSRKQQEVETGRKDLKAKLRRALSMLQREEDALKRESEQVAKTRIIFEDTLHSVEEIDPESWPREQLEENLTEALSLLDHARMTYNENRVKVEVLQDEEAVPAAEEETLSDPYAAAGADDSFLYWFKRGLAFNLPVIILGVLIIVLLLRR